MVAEVSSCPAAAGPTEAGGTECSARELWHDAPNDEKFAAMRGVIWAGDNVIFPLSPPDDEWHRYYAISTANPASGPLMLTTTNGLIEDATSAALSRDGKTLYYVSDKSGAENVWAKPVSGAEGRALTSFQKPGL